MIRALSSSPPRGQPSAAIRATLTKLLRGIAREGPTRIEKGICVAGSASIVLVISMVGAPPCAFARSASPVRASMVTTPATAPATRWNSSCRRRRPRLISAGSLTTNSLPNDARLALARTAPCQFERPMCWLGHTMRRRPATRVNNVPLSASSCRGWTAASRLWRAHAECEHLRPQTQRRRFRPPMERQPNANLTSRGIAQ